MEKRAASITVEKARVLLGSKFAQLTDKQVMTIIKELEELSRIILDSNLLAFKESSLRPSRKSLPVVSA